MRLGKEALQRVQDQAEVPDQGSAWRASGPEWSVLPKGDGLTGRCVVLGPQSPGFSAFHEQLFPVRVYVGSTFTKVGGPCRDNPWPAGAELEVL